MVDPFAWHLQSFKTFRSFVNRNEVCDELQTKKRGRITPSTPRSNFHLISKSNKKDTKNKGNDHQLKLLWLFDKFLLLAPQAMNNLHTYV